MSRPADTPVESPAQNRAGDSLARPRAGSNWLALLFWLLLIVISGLALAPKPPAGADLGWDKLNHLAAFAALGLLARWAWPTQGLLRWLLGLLCYGALLEIAQGLTPNRQAEWADLLADALGLLLALLLSASWQRWQQGRRARAETD